MLCSKCGKEFVSIFSTTCPFCGDPNRISLWDTLFSPTPSDNKKDDKKDPFDPYDWENPDNCSDREYMDDDDYDDFDN